MCSNPEIELPHTLQAEIFLHPSHLSFRLLNGSSLERSESFPWTLDIGFYANNARVNLNCDVPHCPSLGSGTSNLASSRGVYPMKTKSLFLHELRPRKVE